MTPNKLHFSHLIPTCVYPLSMYTFVFVQVCVSRGEGEDYTCHLRKWDQETHTLRQRGWRQWQSECLSESIWALGSKRLTTSGLWHGWSLAINMKMSGSLIADTHSIPSVSVCSPTGSHQCLAATEWRDHPENYQILLAIFGQYACNFPNSLSPDLLHL